MIISRARPLLRLSTSSVGNFLTGSNNGRITQILRNHGFMQYRNSEPPEAYLKQIRGATVFLTSVVWWWVIWRFAIEYEKFLGPKIPDMSEWTDEELGIPPLEEDP